MLEEIHAWIAEHLGRNERADLVSGGNCVRAPPDHERGEGEEVVVVWIIACRVHPRRRILVADVSLVGVDRMTVYFNGIEVAADADVDVTGHVDEMPRSRHERGEPLSARYGALRIHLLDCVDEEVTRARMLRVRSDHALEARECIGDTRLRLAALGPVIPRPDV